jgi:tetratricopeptide (TPR) repeat protein
LQLKEAENAARRAAELEPRNLDYQLDLGEAQEAVNKLDEAELTYRKALNAAPGNITGSVRLGSFLVNRRSDAKRLQEGVALLQKALKRDPKDGYALFSLGRFYLKQKQPTKAIGFLQKAVAVSPDVRESWYSLGRARQMSGDLVGAKKAIQRSQKLSETYRALDTALAWAKRVPRDVSRRRIWRAVMPQQATTRTRYSSMKSVCSSSHKTKSCVVNSNVTERVWRRVGRCRQWMCFMH